MDFIRLHSAADRRFSEVFSLYRRSFPLHEQRLLPDQADALRHSDYHCCAIEEDGRFCGLLLYWETPGFLYVEHFAVCPELRGAGCGSRALAQLLKAPKPVILEIDPPEDDISLRRRGFYLRAGFCENAGPYTHPAYRRGNAPHRLVLLSAPAPLSAAARRDFCTYLRGTVMAGAER